MVYRSFLGLALARRHRVGQVDLFPETGRQ